jgi:hypothetical protein
VLLAQTEEGRHSVLSRSMALRVMIILRITATMMTLDFLLAAASNMAIFKTRAAAEEFVKEDPFILEGVVKPFKIRDWKDSMLPE